MAGSSSDPIVVDEAGSPAEEPYTLFDVESLLQQIGIVASKWIGERSKYTKHAEADIQELIVSVAILLSKIDYIKTTEINPEDINPDGEEMPPPSLLNQFNEVLSNYESLNDVMKSISTDKKRRMDPENSLV